MKKLLPREWSEFLGYATTKDSFINLESFLKREYKEKTIFPAHENIFKAFSYFPPADTKVVILGQDPYHTPHYATGLCFSVPQEKPLTPSLKNIFKEVEHDTGRMRNKSESELNDWAQQGVLLLNSILTVQAGKAASHHNQGWEEFTDAVIKNLSQKNQNIVFILWGNYARSKKEIIDSSKHLVLESHHPSPLSAYRGFFGNNHFTRTNDYLNIHNICKIDW